VSTPPSHWPLFPYFPPEGVLFILQDPSSLRSSRLNLPEFRLPQNLQRSKEKPPRPIPKNCLFTPPIFRVSSTDKQEHSSLNFPLLLFRRCGLKFKGMAARPGPFSFFILTSFLPETASSDFLSSLNRRDLWLVCFLPPNPCTLYSLERRSKILQTRPLPSSVKDSPIHGPNVPPFHPPALDCYHRLIF